MLQAGFGSAILEAIHDAAIDTGPVRRLGIPDRFIEHGDRGDLLSSLTLDKWDCRGVQRAFRAHCNNRRRRPTPRLTT